MLFGIDVRHRCETATVRICDYNALTAADIGRGAPLGGQGPHEKPVAAATLSKYGPETKAALVLVGANELFASVDTTMREVLELVGIADDAQPLGDVMRIAAWAALLLDVYEAQPALLIAALKARAIQQGALETWDVVVSPEAAARASSIEFGFADPDNARADRGYLVRDLAIVDQLMHRVVAPISIAGVDVDASNQLLVENAISRFVAHLLRGSFDVGLARLIVDEAGDTMVDLCAPKLGLLAAFAQANFRIFDRIVPLNGDTVTRFDPRDDAHWRRLVPRIPSVFEIARLTDAGRHETFRILHILLRTLRSLREELPGDGLRDECRRRLAKLADLAANQYGDDALITLQIRSSYEAAAAADLRTRTATATATATATGVDSTFESSAEAGDALLKTWDALVQRWADKVPPGRWLYQIDVLSATVSWIARDIGARGDTARRDAIHERLLNEWVRAFDRIGVDILNASPEGLAAVAQGLTNPLHDWSGLALREAKDDTTFSQALRISTEIVLPLKRAMAARRRNDKTYRFTLQVVTRGLCDSLDRLPTDAREANLALLKRCGNDLLQTSRAQRLLDDDPDTTLDDADVILALAIVRVGITLAEQGAADDSEISPDVVAHFLRLAHAILVAKAGGAAVSPVPNDLASRLFSLQTAWKQQEAVRTVAAV